MGVGKKWSKMVVINKSYMYTTIIISVSKIIVIIRFKALYQV
jgi:hypothetical protein